MRGGLSWSDDAYILVNLTRDSWLWFVSVIVYFQNHGNKLYWGNMVGTFSDSAANSDIFGHVDKQTLILEFHQFFLTLNFKPHIGISGWILVMASWNKCAVWCRLAGCLFCHVLRRYVRYVILSHDSFWNTIEYHCVTKFERHPGRNHFRYSLKV